jgi:hypothetical protein
LIGSSITTAIQRSIHIKLAVMGVSLGKDALEIIVDQLLLVFSLSLEESLDELQPLSESLTSNIKVDYFS